MTGIVALHIIAVLIVIFGIVDTWMHPEIRK